MRSIEVIKNEINSMYERFTPEQLNDFNDFPYMYWNKYHGKFIFKCEQCQFDTEEEQNQKYYEFILEKIKQWFELMDIDKYKKYRKIGLMSLDD